MKIINSLLDYQCYKGIDKGMNNVDKPLLKNGDIVNFLSEEKHITTDDKICLVERNGYKYYFSKDGLIP